MSFFGKLRGNATNGASSTSPAKKDQGPPPLTPLQKMLLDAGPLRGDGSDKFFGMENVNPNAAQMQAGDNANSARAQYGNTCYCNSILQCLYYSVPFREAVVNYPRRSPPETLQASLAKNMHYPDPNAPIEDPKPKVPPTQFPARSAGVPPTQPQKPEDKDSPEYKKKVALSTLPILETTDNAAAYGMKESLFTSLKDLFEAIVASQERVGIVRPYHFLELLRRQYEMFRTAMHQDAHEFLNILLNEVVANMETEAKRASTEADRQSDSQATGSTHTVATTANGSKSPDPVRWVHELFEGTLASETQCLTCEKVSRRDEVFLDLSVDLEQHSSVTACLRKFSEEEMLCERNKFHCDNCGGLQEAEKRMKIKRLPKILALHLKRFKYTDDMQRLQKLFHRIVYPYHLRLFNTTDDAEDPDRLYELYAVVVHIGGGPYHGHYVAIIKTEDRGWLLFDDEMVEPVDKSYVRNFFGDRPGLACAYVLFYQETTFEAMQAELEKEGMPPERDVAELKESVPAHNVNGHLHRTSSADAPPNESPLKPVPSAPQLSTHPERVPSPPVPPLSPTPKPSHFGGKLGSKKSDVQSKKERAREEKERKAAEKEKEKAEKQRRKEAESRLRETMKRENEELKAAIQASKLSKAEEDKRAASSEHSHANGTIHTHPGHGLSHGLHRFKIGSRSFSHTKTKNKENGHKNKVPDVPPLPEAAKALLNNAIPSSSNALNDATKTQKATMSSESPPGTKQDISKVVEKPGLKHSSTTKKSRFSLRNRSFSFM
ncbi:hypothetical protein VTO42DRAFT_2248 [Malbranchea cinnamomea]